MGIKTAFASAFSAFGGGLAAIGKGNFFPWFGGVASGEVDDLDKHTRNIRTGVGMALFFGLLIGTVSFVYTMSVLKGLLAALLLGMMWFMTVGSLDRMLIIAGDKSKRSSTAGGLKFWTLFVGRMCLAIALSYVNSEFVLMGIFSDKIEETISAKHEAKLTDLRTEETVALKTFQEWEQKEQAAISALEGKLLASVDAVVAESEGSGGTKKRGVGTVTEQKAKARDVIKEQLQQKKEAFAKARESGPQKTAHLEAKKKADEAVARFQKTASRDLIDREEALRDLKSQGSIIVVMAFWVMLILEMSGFLANAGVQVLNACALAIQVNLLRPPHSNAPQATTGESPDLRQ
jgi:hypothetical protein